MTSYERHGVSNHRHVDCLSNHFLRLHQRKHQSPCYCPFVRGIHRSPVDSPYKGAVTATLSIWWRHHTIPGWDSLHKGTIPLVGLSIRDDYPIIGNPGSVSQRRWKHILHRQEGRRRVGSPLTIGKTDHVDDFLTGGIIIQVEFDLKKRTFINCHVWNVRQILEFWRIQWQFLKIFWEISRKRSDPRNRNFL